jgi:uncharacterized protein YqeY
MSVSLKEQLSDAMKAAMRAKEKQRLGTIRLIQADIKRIEVDERVELDDARVLAVMDKMVKQRRDSISQFSAAGRTELADIEQAEIEVIQEFLPQPLTEQEIDALIAAAIAESGASSMQQMGAVMAIVKPQIQGRADAGAVSGQVKRALS